MLNRNAACALSDTISALLSMLVPSINANTNLHGPAHVHQAFSSFADVEQQTDVAGADDEQWDEKLDHGLRDGRSRHVAELHVALVKRDDSAADDEVPKKRGREVE